MTNADGGSLGGSSFVHGSSKRSFDIRTEGDVIELLRVVHQNALDAEIKNHLRDLIFAYRQTQNPDDGKRIAQSFAPLGFSVVFTDQAETVSKEKTESVKGFARPMPRFAPVAIRTAPQSSNVAATPEVPKEEVRPDIVQTPAPTTPQAPRSEPSVVPVQEQEVHASQGVTPPTSSAVSASDRIKEIKRLVNEKVGNPVNLMDSHAEIGREYMNALLDAMKKSNGAQGGELDAAMVRLEAAYAHVQTVIEEGNVTVPQTETAPAAKEVPKENPVRASFTPPQPLSQPTPKVVPVPSYQEAHTEPSAPLSASGEVNAVPIRLVSVRENIAEQTSPSPSAQTAKLVRPQEAAAESTPIIHSVAKEKQLQELLRVNKQREVQSKLQTQELHQGNADPLQTPEVTAGLNQLLSEWSLFKSSGIFGTGPNGKDHPLFKKLETLTMAAVIAGRFEGATPAIKQSITDYMNGWRYEEGIVHDHAETFEHYLRKVVAQILNRKKLG